MPKTGNKRILKPEQEAALIEMYKDASLTVAEIAAVFGIGLSTVRKYAVRYGLPARPQKKRKGVPNTKESIRKYELNHNAFDNAETDPVAAYFVGLLLTDGHVRRKRNRGSYEVCFSQSEPRQDVVYKLKEFLGTDKPVFIRPAKDNRRRVHSLEVASKRIYELLGTYGVIPRKTSRQVVNPVFYNNRSFWLGVFEGDGSIRRNRKNSMVLSFGNTSPDLMDRWIAFCETVVGVGNVGVCSHQYPSGNIQRQAFVCGDRAFKLAEHLYEGATVYSDTKYAVYAAMKEKRNKLAQTEPPQPPLPA